jgi:hypothetical protein
MNYVVAIYRFCVILIRPIFVVYDELVPFHGYDNKEVPARKRDDVCLGGNFATSCVSLLRHGRR